MKTVKGDIILTDDGSNTIRHELLGELYHSDRGAVGESEYVYIRQGLEYMAQGCEEVKVFEVGFGTGLNAWLTWEYARAKDIRVCYEAVERYPLDMATVRDLKYTDDKRFEELHRVESEVLDKWFTLTKYEEDLTDFDPELLAGQFDVVYFDAFAPEVQPDLWCEETMRKMYRLLRPGGVLVTYSAKGIVKENLRSAGFEVGRLKGALGKRHMLRAVRR